MRGAEMGWGKFGSLLQGGFIASHHTENHRQIFMRSLERGHYVLSLSVTVSVRCQHRFVHRVSHASHDGRKPARCPCGQVHFCANMDSLTR